MLIEKLAFQGREIKTQLSLQENAVPFFFRMFFQGFGYPYQCFFEICRFAAQRGLFTHRAFVFP